jgi:hypothetical protein
MDAKKVRKTATVYSDILETFGGHRRVSKHRFGDDGQEDAPVRGAPVPPHSPSSVTDAYAAPQADDLYKPLCRERG